MYFAKPLLTKHTYDMTHDLRMRTLGFPLPLVDDARDRRGLDDGHGDVHDVAADLSLDASGDPALLVHLHVDQDLVTCVAIHK